MTGPGAPIFTARHQRGRRPVAHHRRRDGAPHPWIAWRAAPVPVCQASGLHLRQSLQSLGDRPAVFGSVGRRAGGQGDGPRLQPAPSAPTWAAPPGRHDQGAASRGTRRGARRRRRVGTVCSPDIAESSTSARVSRSMSHLASRIAHVGSVAGAAGVSRHGTARRGTRIRATMCEASPRITQHHALRSTLRRQAGFKARWQRL